MTATATPTSEIPAQNSEASSEKKVGEAVAMDWTRSLVLALVLGAELVYGLVNLLPWVYPRLIWLVLSGVMGLVLWRRENSHCTEEAAIFSLVVLMISCVGSLIEVQLDVHFAVVALVNIISIILSVTYLFLPRDYLVYANICLLLVPFEAPDNLVMSVLVYVFCSAIFIIMEYSIHKHVDSSAVAMSLIPFVYMRLWFMLMYFGIVVCIQTAWLYNGFPDSMSHPSSLLARKARKPYAEEIPKDDEEAPAALVSAVIPVEPPVAPPKPVVQPPPPKVKTSQPPPPRRTPPTRPRPAPVATPPPVEKREEGLTALLVATYGDIN